jgi:predicted nucleic acid-binding protein
VLSETGENLAAKRPQALSQFVLFQARVNSVTDPPADLVKQVMRFVAAKDAPIVAAAVIAEAQYLVTLDQRHILAKANEIASQFAITVLTPGEALARFQ